MDKIRYEIAVKIYSISTISSISTAIPIGNEAMPTADRACLPRSPKTSTIKSEKPFITAPQVNRIISDQQFAKSHFTSLRNKLVGDLNEKLFILTKNEKCIIETKLPKDNRIKAYKADSSIIKKKISFYTFLFRN